MKKLITGILLLIMATSAMAVDYPSKPYTFAPRQIISSSKINSDYDTLYDAWSDGDTDINLKELYIGGTKCIDSSRAITVTNITAVGDTTIDGDLTISDEVSANVIRQDGVVVDMDAMQYDVYNFYVKYPYAQSGTESVQEQLIANAGTIDTVKAQLGTDATGADFTLVLFNDTTTINSTGGNTATFPDVSDTISTNAALISGNTVVENTVLKVQVNQVGSTITGQDLRIQVKVDR